MDFAFRALLFGIGFAIPLITIVVVFSPVLRSMVRQLRAGDGASVETNPSPDKLDASRGL